MLAVITLFGGAWALWVDRMDRSGGGFVTIGTSDLRTETYAIEAPLTGDGPDWLYGSTVFGTGRVRGDVAERAADVHRDRAHERR